MSRVSSLDVDSAVETAMALFWSRGYASASLEDLVSASGAARYGLYARFGDKQGLFLAALGRYEQAVVNRLFAGVEAADASLAQVRGYFDALIGLAASPQGRWGCLLVNTAVEAAGEEGPVADVIEAYRRRLALGFARAMARACQRGEAPAGLEAEAAGEHLVALSFGISVMARSGAPVSALRAAADGALTPFAAA
jgi:TetR/AcrR family transcriptional repressor of nem operon